MIRLMNMIRSSWRIMRRALNSTLVVVVVIVAIWLVAGIAFSVIENTTLLEGLWWASVTGSTTGYGDYYPVTVAGRIFGQFFMAFSVIFTAFFTAHVVAAVIEDKNKYTHAEQERNEAALCMIMVAMKLIPEESRELPSLEWFKEHGFKESADE